MKSNELRIGNLVSKEGLVYEADFITIRMAQNYKPIPLTEELLLKFGFEEYGDIHDNFMYKDWIWYSLNEKCLDIRRGESHPWTLIPLSIKYVHQLQNLYFALTGEELTIKL